MEIFSAKGGAGGAIHGWSHGPPEAALTLALAQTPRVPRPRLNLPEQGGATQASNSTKNIALTDGVILCSKCTVIDICLSIYLVASGDVSTCTAASKGGTLEPGRLHFPPKQHRVVAHALARSCSDRSSLNADSRACTVTSWPSPPRPKSGRHYCILFGCRKSFTW